MKKTQEYWFFGLLSIVLIAFRTWLGAHINFCHEDYEQVYLIGLEYITKDGWSYWGPDVVWSETRLAGALQAMLVGIPLSLSKNAIAPFVLSNIISSLGLILLSLYISYRLNYSKILVLIFVMSLPFMLYHGSVLLNTAYLLLPGALVIISVLELFLYRDDTLLKNKYLYFGIMGFSVFFVYQLHLTWVMILPYMVVLAFLEWRRKELSLIKISLYTLIGMCLSFTLIAPTLFKFHELIFSGVEGNLALNLGKVFSIVDLTTRILTYTSFNVSTTFEFYGLASINNAFIQYGLIALKYIGVLQLLGFFILLWLKRKDTKLMLLLLLFCLSLLMALFLYVISNKHLESRTYILLFALPVFVFFYSLQGIQDKKWFTPMMYFVALMSLGLHLGVGLENRSSKYSINRYQEKVQKAIESKDARHFGIRRVTKMD